MSDARLHRGEAIEYEHAELVVGEASLQQDCLRAAAGVARQRLERVQLLFSLRGSMGSLKRLVAIPHHSASRVRIISGLSGFLTLIQSRDGPDGRAVWGCLG